MSGNVKAKLAAAEIAADENPKYARNVEALKEVQPAPLDASQITARLGSTWIDTNIYRQFILKLLDVNRLVARFDFRRIRRTYGKLHGKKKYQRGGYGGNVGVRNGKNGRI